MPAKEPKREFEVGDKIRVNLHHGKIEDACCPRSDVPLPPLAQALRLCRATCRGILVLPPVLAPTHQRFRTSSSAPRPFAEISGGYLFLFTVLPFPEQLAAVIKESEAGDFDGDELGKRGLHCLHLWPECGPTLWRCATSSKEVSRSRWFVRHKALREARSEARAS
jgi:hypothetical protein